MAARRISKDERPARRPAKTLSGREHQLVSLAIDLAEKQLLDGTASAQVLSHYLKLGSTREVLEQQRLRNENLLLEVKVEAIQQGQRMEVLYEDAIKAMRRYQGQEVEEEYYE